MPKAYVFTRYGGPETEAPVDVERPRPGPGEVPAAGVDPVGRKRRTGCRRPGESGGRAFPAVLGDEVAGAVAGTGEDVAVCAPGDQALGTAVAGGHAEGSLTAAGAIAHRPAGLSVTDAATLPVAAAPVRDGVHRLGPPARSRLPVTGAGGAGGVAVVRIARSLGVRVVGVTSEGEKDSPESPGAGHVPLGPGWTHAAREAVPDGSDGVHDLVGGEVLREAAALVRDRSRLITAGAPAAEAERPGGARVARARDAAVPRAVADLVVRGALDAHVTHPFPPERAAEAAREAGRGHARGTVVLEIGAGI